MKNLSLFIAVTFCALQFSCKQEDNTEEIVPTENTTIESTQTGVPVAEETKQNSPKTYTIIATPEVVILGKKEQASIKIINMKALELSDPDGKITGTELTYQMEITNKNTINNGGSFRIQPSDFRLELDNGNKISHDDYSSLSVKEEETQTSDLQKFKLPAGTKPATLHFFFEETRVPVKLEMK